MAGGRPRKPVALHKLTGSYRADRHGTKVDAPRPAKTPTCPSWLGKEARAEWRRIAATLHSLGLLAQLDVTVLAACCTAAGEVVEATRVLEAEGRILDVDVFDKAGVKTGTRKKAHPAVALQRSALTAVRQYLSEFGLTPASRARLPEMPPPDTGPDPFEELLDRADKSRFFHKN